MDKANEVCELTLKTISYTLVYSIAIVFMGLNIAIILGFGYFTYSEKNPERNVVCAVEPGLGNKLPMVNVTTAQEAKLAGAENVSLRFSWIFAIGFWVYIFAWMCYIARLLSKYCLAKDILFFNVILYVLLFMGFVQFVFATIYRFDHAGKVCSSKQKVNGYPNLEDSGTFLEYTVIFQWALLAMMLSLLIIFKLREKQEMKNRDSERRRIFGESTLSSSRYSNSFVFRS